ncbi:MAG TPA: tetratricopeptide repeat protein [Terriglobales bacterium]|jgi:tetratricopeptide (TPR) repeat protein|nr:tetratricopeptide repeat protein [Terriglobales bacterium]
MKTRSHLLFCSTLLACLIETTTVDAQQNLLGKIVGSIRMEKGDFPVHPVLVELEMRGAPIASVYTDDRGRFGFYSLIPNQYRVAIEDPAYEPVSQTTDVNPATSPVNFVELTLTPRSEGKKDALPGRLEGSNPFLIDPTDYYRKFPKKTVKEFEKGVDAEHHGKTDEAIKHYENALSFSPDFYPAHNNLGSAYLSRQNFEGAQREFEAALKSNQNDAQAYFNLANLLLLTQRYDDAEREIGEGLQRRPDSAFGYFLQGSLYSRTQRSELAEKSLLNALRLDSRMSQAYLQLVNLYLQQKRTHEAISQLEAYLKAFPDTPFSPQARTLLKRLQGTPPPSK